MAVRAAWCVAGLFGLASPAPAEDCRLALVLALDVSESVDAHEDWLQREGLARALLAPEVMRAFLVGDPVALFVFEWSDLSTQVPILPGWELVQTEEDLARVADAVASSRRTNTNSPTALGAALAHAAGALAEAPKCRARTIDVAADGWSNNGHDPSFIYRTLPQFGGVTVNALIVFSPDSESRLVNMEALVTWFEANVLRGPGAFWILASDYEDYERAMRAKLLRELELAPMSGSFVSARAG
jgi:hypothetical protein